MLYLIQDSTHMGDNSDTFVNAASVEDAIQSWRDQYELEDAFPERVIEVPTLTERGAITWDAITQHFPHCNNFSSDGRGACINCGHFHGRTHG